MMSFFQEFFCDEMAFLRCALLAGLLAAPVVGVVGTLVVTRRISSLAGASAHSALGGIGLALFLQRVCGLAWCLPVVGAMIGAVISAVVAGVVSLRRSEREDTAIGVVWAFGMAVGMLFLSVTPGYVDWQGYLFGNILLLDGGDIKLLLAIDALVLIPWFCFYPQLLAMGFDSVYARLRGVNVNLLYLGLLAITALTIVALMRVVGILLVIALLTIPAAVAGKFTLKLWSMALLAAILSVVFVWGGLATSYWLELPSGPAVATLAGIAYIVVALWRGRKAKVM